MKVRVKVPASRYGRARLRKPGAKQLRLQDTDDEIRAGLMGGTPSKMPEVPITSDYFTEEPEEVEYTTWVERMVRRGSLEIVRGGAPVPASPPKTKPKAKATSEGSEPVPMTDKDKE